MTTPTAAVLIIGNEILSGRTQDINLNYIAKKLTAIGIKMAEARIIPDIEGDIVAAAQALSSRYDYVFTSGGIGPTHDDITVDSIAKAFNVAVIEHPEARRRLLAYYTEQNITPARLRMARIPETASLIDNPVSLAPGFKIGNVHCMAGVPNIMQAMMDGIISTLRQGPEIISRSVSGYVPESTVADDLRAVAEAYTQLEIGSYPWVRNARYGTALVARGTDKNAINQAISTIHQFMQKHDPESIVE